MQHRDMQHGEKLRIPSGAAFESIDAVCRAHGFKRPQGYFALVGSLVLFIDASSAVLIGRGPYDALNRLPIVCTARDGRSLTFDEWGDEENAALNEAIARREAHNRQ